MFFVGFFASPLPYLLLLGLYVSGYAWYSLNTHEHCQEVVPVTSKIIVLGSQHQHPTLDAATASWPVMQDIATEESSYWVVYHQPLILVGIAEPPFSEDFSLTTHPIRPPPQA